MKIKSTTISLTVANTATSSAFLQKHFGFGEKFAAEKFAYMHHNTNGLDIVLLGVGSEVLAENMRNQAAQGIIVAFVVDDIEAEEKRLTKAGVAITMPLQEDPWGEKLFQVTDPNGVVYQIVQWVAASDEQYAENAGNQNW